MSYRKKAVTVFIAMLLIFSLNEEASAGWFTSAAETAAKVAYKGGKAYAKDKIKGVFAPSDDKNNSANKKKK